MRPVKLAVTGLRSHTTTTEVAFPDDWQLAAVVGPTGAGKSSLLEAIVYALFGSGTVPNASQPTNLIADNVAEMRVVLEFDVGGTRHDVVRSYRRRGSSPPPVLRSPGATVSGAKPVDEAISRLLGLSQDAFCQTALLPQGRFAARLLEANGNDQRRTLDEFFRLSEVSEVADRIAAASDVVATARDRVSTVRRQLPVDPDADVRAAVERLAVARDAAAAAAEVHAAVEGLLEEARLADERAGQHAARQDDLQSVVRALMATIGEAERLAAVGSALDAEEASARADHEQARSALDVARRRLDDLDPGSVAATRAVLANLRARIREADEAAAEAARFSEAVATASRDHDVVVQEQRTAAERHETARAALAAAEREATKAASAAAEGEGLADRVGRVSAEAARARGLLAQAQADLDEAVAASGLAEAELRRLEERASDLAAAAKAADEVVLAAAAFELGQAQRDHDTAASEHTHAEQVLIEQRRAAAAAAAAAGCGAGDACPVCQRELPEGFEPPPPPVELSEADTAERAARQRLNDATVALMKARQQTDIVGPTDGVGPEVGVSFEQAKAAADAAHRELAIVSTSAQSAAASLAPLAAARARAERSRTSAADTAAIADAATAEADAAFDRFGGPTALVAARAAADELDRRRAALEAQAGDAEVAVAALAEQAAELRLAAANAETRAAAATDRAEAARKAAGDGAKLVPGDAGGGSEIDRDPAAVAESAQRWMTEREAAIAAVRVDVDDAERRLARSTALLEAIVGRRTSELDAPLAELTNAAAGLAGRAGIAPPPAAKSEALRDWAIESGRTADELQRAEADQAHAARESATRARASAEAKCRAAGIDLEMLGGWLKHVEADVVRAEEARQRADEVRVRAAQLDEAMSATADRARLLENGKALGRGRHNFVMHVLATRRRQLLVEASAILAELSGDRLQFDVATADRFSVIDGATAAARDPRLLSGGEQFQASLALALGLVEIAARGGSRIECLFLDEGFGALDARSLDTALDALEMAGWRGRRILAVTHVDAVTARCDHVLEVRPGLGGSQVKWRELAAV